MKTTEEISIQVKKLLEIYRVEDLAHFIGVSAITIRRWRDGKNLPRHRDRIMIQRLLKKFSK